MHATLPLVLLATLTLAAPISVARRGISTKGVDTLITVTRSPAQAIVPRGGGDWNDEPSVDDWEPSDDDLNSWDPDSWDDGWRPYGDDDDLPDVSEPDYDFSSTDDGDDNIDWDNYDGYKLKRRTDAEATAVTSGSGGRHLGRSKFAKGLTGKDK